MPTESLPPSSLPASSLPAYADYPFAPADSAAWAARIAAETKGRATAEQLERPTDDGTRVRPYYTAADRGATPPSPLPRHPGWRLIEDLSALDSLAPVADVVRTTSQHAQGLLVAGSAAAQARALLGEQHPLLIRLRPDAVDLDSLLHPADHYLIEAAGPGGQPLMHGNHWTLREQHSLLIDLTPLAEAGASAAQQLGVLLQLLGPVAEQQAPRLWVNLSVGLSLAPELAKLRAARRLLRQHLPHTALTLHVTTAHWPLSRREPHTNLVRTTTQAFTAVVGGADALSLYPYDGVSQLPTAEGVRLARNISHLMRHESHLDAVADPAAGSHSIEALTAQLMAGAHDFAGQIAARGGLAAAHASGWLPQQVAAVAAARAQGIAQGDAKTGAGRVIVGVNAFRAPEAAPLPPAPDAFDAQQAALALRPWRGPAAAE